MSEDSYSSASSSIEQDDLAEWKKLSERVKSKHRKKYFRYAVREIANELQDGNPDNFLHIEKQPSGG